MSQPNLFDTPDPSSDEQASAVLENSAEAATLENSADAATLETDTTTLEATVETNHPEVILHAPVVDERGIPPGSKFDPLPPAPRQGGTRLPKRVVLVDGHALAYRSYFALQRAGDTLKTSAGEPTQAVYGFMKTLLKLHRAGDKKAGRDQALIVVFDPPVKTFRHDLYTDYKAGRATTPDDLPAQIRRIKEIVDAMGLVRVQMDGYEADDVIASLAKQAEAQRLEVRILTSDRDAYQLLSDKVRVIGSDDKEIGPDEVKTKYGVTVQQWVDYRALTGDSSDNIPGAKGIGPKSAQKLLETYNSLEYILEHLDEIEPKKDAQKIRDSRENVVFSQELSRMVTTLDLSVDFAAAKDFVPDVPKLTGILRALEMNSFIRDLALEQRSSFETLPWAEPREDAIWGYRLSLANDPVSAELEGIAYADPAAANAVREGGPEFKPTGTLRAADSKALSVFVNASGGASEPGDDPWLMAWTMDPNNNDPQAITARYLQEDWAKDAPGRAAQTAKLLEVLEAQFTPEARTLYETLERPTAVVLGRMETRGIRIDSDAFRELSKGFATRMAQLESEIWGHAGEEFNINSRDKLESILYDKLQLESGKKTKLTGKRSTAVTALEPLRDLHPIIGLLLEYRELHKLRGTYLEPLPTLVSPITGRLHTVFNQLGTATGRVSSVNPNLQNIPVRTAVGRDIRKGFVAEAGHKLISADYSQIELRILAHITKEPALLEGFRLEEDIHRRTAAVILNIPLESVTTDQRRGAKTINYGVLYGMSAHRLARDVGLPYDEAKKFIEAYFGAYPGIDQYLESTKEFCRANGYVQDLFGRRRYLPDINAKAFPVREAAERMAINMPIQGTSAGIIKRAMIDLDAQLEAMGAKLLLQVHDELVIEARVENVEEVGKLVERVMADAYKLDVPLGVGVGIGDSWYDAK
jgi:DNA polymerase-1